MCILVKLHYAKFDVSRLFCSKVIEEKPLGGWLDPPGKGRVETIYHLFAFYEFGSHQNFQKWA